MNMNLGSLISGQISLIAQHDSSRLGFLALITALCKARGVTSDSLTFESLSPTINLAYIKKNFWNLDDPSVTFRGTRKSSPEDLRHHLLQLPLPQLLLHQLLLSLFSLHSLLEVPRFWVLDFFNHNKSIPNEINLSIPLCSFYCPFKYITFFV